MRNRANVGKRRSINRAVREPTSEIIVSVDSDVVVEPDAIRELVRRFTEPRIAAVGGWVDIRNKHDNWLTRMQVVKYWYAYYVLKNLERAFSRVMCPVGLPHRVPALRCSSSSSRCSRRARCSASRSSTARIASSPARSSRPAT